MSSKWGRLCPKTQVKNVVDVHINEVAVTCRKIKHYTLDITHARARALCLFGAFGQWKKIHRNIRTLSEKLETKNAENRYEVQIQHT